MLLTLLLLALPERVTHKTLTQSFTASHEIVVHEGKLWWRKPGETWALIPPDGLPIATPSKKFGAARSPFTRPSRIESISADGDNLVALGPDGLVYYTKLAKLEWVDRWGPIGAQGRLSASGLDALAMSHRFIAYEDLDGNSHPVSAGVTTLFALKDQGHTLGYADPWLPPNFDREVCLPERGRFVAARLAASASTVAVMDVTGRLFTRLVDFDIAGENPLLTYTYARERRKGRDAEEIRTLPGPDWVEQPRIPGRHALELDLFQTGPHNGDRQLRVLGEGGVWSKRIDAAEWTFEAGEGAAKDATWATSGEPPRGPARDANWSGVDPWLGATVTLEDFHSRCAPTRLQVTAGDEHVTLELPFHHVLLWGSDASRTLHGAVLIPAGDGPWLTKLRAKAKGRPYLDVELRVRADEVRLTHATGVMVRFHRAP